VVGIGRILVIVQNQELQPDQVAQSFSFYRHAFPLTWNNQNCNCHRLILVVVVSDMVQLHYIVCIALQTSGTSPLMYLPQPQHG
jgi:hypothetical protein